MFSAILHLDPTEIFLRESQRELDDDYILEYEERQMKRRQANWFYDEECDDWAWDGEE